jgi:hypothetical protein
MAICINMNTPAAMSTRAMPMALVTVPLHMPSQRRLSMPSTCAHESTSSGIACSEPRALFKLAAAEVKTLFVWRALPEPVISGP